MWMELYQLRPRVRGAFSKVQRSLANTAMGSLADLPEDVILHILQLCAVEDALILTQVCLCSAVCPLEGH